MEIICINTENMDQAANGKHDKVTLGFQTDNDVSLSVRIKLESSGCSTEMLCLIARSTEVQLKMNSA